MAEVVQVTTTVDDAVERAMQLYDVLVERAKATPVDIFTHPTCISVEGLVFPYLQPPQIEAVSRRMQGDDRSVRLAATALVGKLIETAYGHGDTDFRLAAGCPLDEIFYKFDASAKHIAIDVRGILYGGFTYAKGFDVTVHNDAGGLAQLAETGSFTVHGGVGMGAFGGAKHCTIKVHGGADMYLAEDAEHCDIEIDNDCGTCCAFGIIDSVFLLKGSTVHDLGRCAKRSRIYVVKDVKADEQRGILGSAHDCYVFIGGLYSGTAPIHAHSCVFETPNQETYELLNSKVIDDKNTVRLLSAPSIPHETL